MPSMNQHTIIGHLGKDPEVRTTNSGDECASFSVATSEGYKDKSGQWQDKTDWHNVVVWNKHAINTVKKLSKGSLVLVQGKVQTRKWTDKDGNERYSTETVVGMYDGKVEWLNPVKGEGKGEDPSRKQNKMQPQVLDDDIMF